MRNSPFYTASKQLGLELIYKDIGRLKRLEHWVDLQCGDGAVTNYERIEVITFFFRDIQPKDITSDMLREIQGRIKTSKVLKLFLDQVSALPENHIENCILRATNCSIESIQKHIGVIVGNHNTKFSNESVLSLSGYTLTSMCCGSNVQVNAILSLDPRKAATKLTVSDIKVIAKRAGRRKKHIGWVTGTRCTEAINLLRVSRQLRQGKPLANASKLVSSDAELSIAIPGILTELFS